MVNGIDASERIDVYFQVGQGDIRARLERRSVTSCGRVKDVDRGKDGVGIDSGAAAASVGGVVTTRGVFVGLEGL